MGYILPAITFGAAGYFIFKALLEFHKAEAEENARRELERLDQKDINDY